MQMHWNDFSIFQFRSSSNEFFLLRMKFFNFITSHEGIRRNKLTDDWHAWDSFLNIKQQFSLRFFLFFFRALWSIVIFFYHKCCEFFFTITVRKCRHTQLLQRDDHFSKHFINMIMIHQKSSSDIPGAAFKNVISLTDFCMLLRVLLFAIKTRSKRENFLLKMIRFICRRVFKILMGFYEKIKTSKKYLKI